jgi:murein DD-endopeptidase MepM/ murein hydrolase activator NlpD
MKNKILITVTTLSGSKQYTITEIIKKFVISIAISIVLFLIAAIFIIRYLSDAVEQKTNEVDNLLQIKFSLENSNKTLKSEINKKEKILNEVNDKISDIERILQIDSPENTNNKERLDLAKIHLIDKKLVLRNIPNGYPVEYKGVTSRFGYRTHPITKKREFHTGIDLRAKMNSKVYAPADGIINFAKYHKKSGYGNLLILDHNFGFKTLYGHLNKFAVKQGDFVKKGDLIAYTGNSGLSSGPHLHYEIRYVGVVLDPKSFLKWDLKNYDLIFQKEKRVKWQSLIKAIQWQKRVIQQL